MLMTLLVAVLITVEVLSSLLLLGAILIQRTRSQGMGLAFGAGVGETMFGSQAGNVLTRATVILSFIFLLNTTVLGILGTRGRERSAAEAIAADVAVAPPVTAPAPMPAPVGAPAPGGSVDFASLPAGDMQPAAPVAGEAAPMGAMPVEAMPAPAADAVPPVAPAAPEAAPATP